MTTELDSAQPTRPFDLVVNRALVFVALTGLGVLTYAVVLVVISPWISTRSATGVLLGAALAAVLLAGRNLAQRGVDWLMYGDRTDPYRALVKVGSQAEWVTDPSGLLPTLTETLASSLRLSYLAVHTPARTCEVGTMPSRTWQAPLLNRGQEVGRVVAGRRGERLSRADQTLIAAAAPQLAAAAEAMRLHESLALARDRLVRAREEERRRLRHDLHDALGPTLAGIGLGLDAARSRARRDPPGADGLLCELQDEVRGCVGEVRRIIDGLRPPALDERGLIGALEHRARAILDRSADLAVSVHGSAPSDLPAAVEVNAYLIAQEAVTNAVRHAGATRVDVAVHAERTALVIEVSDDGRGLSGSDTGQGIGMTSMAARAQEIGGVLDVSSMTEVGTRITARLPL